MNFIFLDNLVNLNFLEMGGTDSKLEQPNANVINEIKVEVQLPIIYFIIIIVILALQLLTTLYQLHKRSLRKGYARAASVANNLDKV